MKIFSVSNIVNGKVISLPKTKETSLKIQEFLKKISIKKDYRKHFLKSISEDMWYNTSTKNGDILVCSFVTTSKIFLQVIFFSEEGEKLALESIMECFKE